MLTSKYFFASPADADRGSLQYKFCQSHFLVVREVKKDSMEIFLPDGFLVSNMNENPVFLLFNDMFAVESERRARSREFEKKKKHCVSQEKKSLKQKARKMKETMIQDVPFNPSIHSLSSLKE